jgi:RNA polymerase sigma factor FliA
MFTETGRRLTAPEAETLWRAWHERNDQQARDRLVLAYSPMVRYIASRKVRELPAHLELGDLVSCGLIALLEATDRFDPAKGATFEQYAWTRVSGALMDELRRQDWVSRSTRRIARRAEAIRESRIAATGVAPREDELASLLQVDVEELRRRLVETARADFVSLNAHTRNSEPGSIEICDTIAARPLDGEPEHVLLNAERASMLREAIAGLSERECQVFTLVHVHGLPGAEIGAMLGVSESRVSQILSGVREKLRAHIARYEAVAA